MKTKLSSKKYLGVLVFEVLAFEVLGFDTPNNIQLDFTLTNFDDYFTAVPSPVCFYKG